MKSNPPNRTVTGFFPLPQPSALRGFFAILVAALSLCLAPRPARATIDAALQMQLGNPSGAITDPSNTNHYLIQRTVQALDYSSALGEPYWASWDLTIGDVGSSGRSAVFFPDTNLPPGFNVVPSSAYDGDSAVNIDRGHLCPSDDRTDNTNDNNLVFLMSNIIPQASANNEGVWGSFEGYCRTQAQAGNELLIICGPAGFGTNRLPSNAQVIIPTNTWKIAVIVPLGAGTALSRITTSTRVISLIIPNNNQVVNNWSNYVTSASQIEALTGFTFFTAVPPVIASALRSRVDGLTNPPVPGITSFSPSNGVGGNSVVITGSNFTSASVVSFNNVAAVFSVDLPTQITAIVPTNATSGQIRVTTPSATATSPGVFTVNNSGNLPVIAQQPQGLALLVGQNANFTVNVTSTLTVGYQWQFNGNNINAATATNYAINNAQLTDAGNYRVIVTNSAGAATSSVAVLIVTNNLPSVIAQWNFNNTSLSTTSPPTSLGTGVSALAGGTSGAYVSGSGSTDTNTTNNAWNTAAYGTSTSGNKTRGASFSVNTTGWRSLRASWDQRVSPTASKYFRLQYSTNGTDFVDGPVITMTTNNDFESRTNDFSAVPGINNNPNFALRVVAEFESTAIGSANANYITTSTNGFGSTGTVRFDMFTVFGEPIPTNVPPPVLSPATVIGGQIGFSITGIAGLQYIIQASTNLITWTPLQTNVSPFSFSENKNLPQRFYRAQYLP